MSSGPTSAGSISLFRRLVWAGTVPLEIVLDARELAALAGPAGAASGVNTYFINVPRIWYLPLVLPLLRKELLALAVDEEVLRGVRDEELWFEAVAEGEVEGVPCRWHWPLGLLYDYHVYSSPPPTHLSSPSPSLPHLIPSPSPAPTSSHGSLPAPPLRLVLHLRAPPADKLFSAPGAEACRVAYFNALKEGEAVRWGKTKRVTELGRRDTEGIWEGVEKHDFDHFYRIASKLFPLPTSSTSPPPPPSSNPQPDPPGPSSGIPTPPRAVPLKLYLPDQLVLQDLLPPNATLGAFLSTHAPLIFPAPGSGKPTLGRPIVHGVEVPMEAELGWLGGVLLGADGWLRVVVGVVGQ